MLVETGDGEREVAGGRFEPLADTTEPVDLSGLRATGPVLPGAALYGGTESQRGPALTTVVRAWPTPGQVLAELRLPDEFVGFRYADTADPALLDGAYVASLAALPARAGAGGDPASAAGVWIPFLIERVRAYEPVGAHCHCLVRHVRSLPDTEIVDVTFCADDGRVLLALDGFTYRYARYTASTPAGPTTATGPVDTEPAGGVKQRVAAYLTGRLAALNGDRPVDPRATFMDLGIDSTALIGLARTIEGDLGLELYPTLFFEYQTVEELSAWFAGEHPEAFPPQTMASPSPAAPAEASPSALVAGAGLSGSAASAVSAEVTPTASAGGAVPEDAVAGPRVRDRPTGRDIAIIGMAGRFAGSPDLDTFWHHLRAGTDLISEIPPERWDWRPWFDADRDRPGRTYSRWGSFIEADRFDATFFGIAPREARWLDPQLRLLLEVTHAAVEDAGYGRRLHGSRTGVYVGSCFRDYWDEIVRAGLPIGDYEGGAGLVSALAGRLSYTFDLRGPSVPVDNACASSLTALHLAVRALRGGECDTAVVAGVNLILSPLHHVNGSRVQALSPTGRCHTFDARADGYVPGEGVVALLLKPLEAALRDGDSVHAVIKGSAANHGGRANNPTAPRPEAQTGLLVDAWADAGITADTIGYIEAHGTGTLLGDPIEVRALTEAFSRHTDRVGFCGLGSAKAHLGHLEGAAGLAGVVKVVLSMRHGELPAMPGFRDPNPYLSLESSPLRVDRTVTPWPSTASAPRRAGVSSFGLTGSNAHVVIEEAPEPLPAPRTGSGPYLLLLSARSAERLHVYSALLAEHLDRVRPPLADVAHTLCAGREPMRARLAVLADDHDEAVRLLRATQSGTLGGAATGDSASAALAARWLAGEDVPAPDGRLIRLPTYPFAGELHWFPVTSA
ncbi:polyketide synthase, partial [Micromonospora sp. ATCC 39149]|uniref:beta-ketoacyl synthase N-terminal-like domain-containing protein n=1 Tax=Micromonospora sp. (strain ATCC 39149 / NRRL 15099 / SCC 1413) TaxID=219305 RepID=UPI0001A50A97